MTACPKRGNHETVDVLFRTDVRASDPDAVLELVGATSFFSRAEQLVAAELVEEARTRGPGSGYRFVFADTLVAPDKLAGYVCFGPIPVAESSYDLYWLAVSPGNQRRGLGRRLVREAERLAREAGATRMYVDTAGRPQYAPTRAFYERAGYRRAANLPDFYAPGDDKVIYSRAL